jgi:hypothetical protein
MVYKGYKLSFTLQQENDLLKSWLSINNIIIKFKNIIDKITNKND